MEDLLKKVDSFTFNTIACAAFVLAPFLAKFIGLLARAPTRKSTKTGWNSMSVSARIMAGIKLCYVTTVTVLGVWKRFFDHIPLEQFLLNSVAELCCISALLVLYFGRISAVSSSQKEEKSGHIPMSTIAKVKAAATYLYICTVLTLAVWKWWFEDIPLENFLWTHSPTIGAVWISPLIPILFAPSAAAIAEEKKVEKVVMPKSEGETKEKSKEEENGNGMREVMEEHWKGLGKLEQTLTLFMWMLVLTSVVGFHLYKARASAVTFTPVAYSFLARAAREDQVKKITFYKSQSKAFTHAQGQFNASLTLPQEDEAANSSLKTVVNFTAQVPSEVEELLGMLERSNSTEIWVVDLSVPDATMGLLLSLFLPMLLIFMWSMVRRTLEFMGSKGKLHDIAKDGQKVSFADVAGQKAAKKELEQLVDFLKKPEKYTRLGAKVPRGVLLVGPPGTGKTLLARAVAGEATAPFFSISASEFVEVFVGLGASRVRTLFAKARKAAPAIVFIDEIDAVGQKRGMARQSHAEQEQTLNQLLSEMDGFDLDDAKRLIIIAATNRPESLDKALLRPGRFDRQISVDIPDRDGRLETLQVHTRDKPLGENVDLSLLAKTTIGFSGADLGNLCNEAALVAATEGAEAITQQHFTQAFERIILGSERPPLVDEEERRITAFHESGHALTALLLPEADDIWKVTITPRGQALGVTAFVPKTERRNQSKKYLVNQILVALGGRAAEEIVFNDITTGASNDLHKCMELATRIVTQFGMSGLGQLNYKDLAENSASGAFQKVYGEETAAKIDEEVQELIDECYHKTKSLLATNVDKLTTLAESLLEKEVIEMAEVKELLNL